MELLYEKGTDLNYKYSSSAFSQYFCSMGFLEGYILFQISQFLMGSGAHFLCPLGNAKMRAAGTAARMQGIQGDFSALRAVPVPVPKLRG